MARACSGGLGVASLGVKTRGTRLRLSVCLFGTARWLTAWLRVCDAVPSVPGVLGNVELVAKNDPEARRQHVGIRRRVHHRTQQQKPSMALVPPWFTIFAVLLPNVMLAALVTMFAPLNCSVPFTVYAPPVSVVPEKLVRLPFTSKVSPVPTTSEPLLVKLPAVVKLRLEPKVKLAPAALVAKLASPLVVPVPLILEFAPVSVMLAALVTMFAAANWNVPVIL